MPKHFILGRYYDLPHTVVFPVELVFKVTPWLAKAREQANLYGEAIAIYRYLDENPGDVFTTGYHDFKLALSRGWLPERVCLEAVVNPTEGVWADRITHGTRTASV